MTLRPEADDRLLNLSVAKAFAVLQAFNDGPAHMTIQQLAERSEMDRSATQRAVHTLHKLGYLQQDKTTKRYAIGHLAMDLAFNFLRGNRLVEMALPHLSMLTLNVRQSIHFSVLDGNDLLYLVRLPMGHQAIMASLPGRRRPAFASAGGRAILALLPEDDARAIVHSSNRPQITPHTLTDPDRIMAEVAKARTTGLAICSEELLLGDLALAVALKAPDGTLATIQLICSALEYTPSAAEAAFRAPLFAARNAISLSLQG